jgi:hypothetical protein
MIAALPPLVLVAVPACLAGGAAVYAYWRARRSADRLRVLLADSELARRGAIEQAQAARLQARLQPPEAAERRRVEAEADQRRDALERVLARGASAAVPPFPWQETEPAAFTGGQVDVAFEPTRPFVDVELDPA